MNPQLKAVVAIAPQSVTNGQTVTGNIDTLGYDWLTLDVYQATSNNTTNNLSTCKLSESDTTDATNFSDITKFVGDGTGGFTIPAANTSDGQVYKFNVNLRGRKRYLKLTVTPVTTQIMGAFANLGIAEQAPVSATNAGVAALVEG